MDEIEYSAWESEFRRSGKDRQFNSHIAFRRLDIALLSLWREIGKPLIPVIDRLEAFLGRIA